MTLTRAIRIVTLCGAALLAVLILTGLYLNWFYRPTGAGLSFGDLGGLETSFRIAHGVRALHVAASSAFIWTGAALAVMCIVGAVRQTQETSRRVAAFATGFAVLALAASFTGYLLPWDQIALLAVTVGARFHGAWDAAFSDQVRFVLIDGSEITQAAYRGWFIVHTVVLPIALSLLALVLIRGGLSHGSTQEQNQEAKLTA